MNWDQLDPNKVYDHMVEVADRYAESQRICDLAEAAAEHAFDTAFLALRGEPGSIESKKALARTSDRHQQALAAYINAKKAALRDKLEWTATTTKLEFVRTLETSRRAQAQYIDKARG